MKFDKDDLNDLPFGFAAIKTNGKIDFTNKEFDRMFFSDIKWTDFARKKYSFGCRGSSPFGAMKSGQPSDEELHNAGAVDYFHKWTSRLVDAPTHFITYPSVFDKTLTDEVRKLASFRRDFRFLSYDASAKRRFYWVDDVTKQIATQREVEETQTSGDALIKRVHIGPEPVTCVFYAIDQKLGKLGGDFYFLRREGNDRYLVFFVGDAAGKGLKAAMISLLAGIKLGEICQAPRSGAENVASPDPDTVDDSPVSIFSADNPALAILHELDRFLEDSFASPNPASRLSVGLDGMACVFDLVEKKLHYADGNFEIWRARGGQIESLGRMREPDGSFTDNGSGAPGRRRGKSIGAGWKGAEFSAHVVDLENADVFFSASDGVFDQVGPEADKDDLSRFTKQRFEALLKDQVSRNEENLKSEDFNNRFKIAKSIVKRIKKELERHRGRRGAEPPADRVDDQLIVGLVVPDLDSVGD